MSSTFIPSFMTSMKSFNYNQLKNIKVKSELNPEALEFIPENIKKDDFKSTISKDKEDEQKFDKLEKDFIKNNEWIFYV
jgi:tRNA G37 N-methylase Trm5